MDQLRDVGHDKAAGKTFSSAFFLRCRFWRHLAARFRGSSSSAWVTGLRRFLSLF